MDKPHVPILCNKVLEFLDIQADDRVVDGTIGYAGHSELIFDKLGKEGILIGIDQDQTSIKYCQKHFSLNE